MENSNPINANLKERHIVKLMSPLNRSIKVLGNVCDHFGLPCLYKHHGGTGVTPRLKRTEVQKR